MDKYEYKIRSDEIKTLIAQGDYAQAAEIADTIDWRRVKSVMMLCTISDLYKINRRYEDAKNMLLLAYEKRPGGRTICYSLCELCIKMEDVVQALKYYKEFVQVAPKDTGRYILQYKIYEAQNVSLEERIGVLEEMKKRDYREKWAYELAYLYHRMGLATRCVEECDELILWFGDGKYVVKAMELKMLHQPLTPAQQEIYDRRFEEVPEETDQGVGDSEIYEESAEYGQQVETGQEAYGWASEDGQFNGDGQEDGQPGYDGDFQQMEGESVGEMEEMPPAEMDEMDIHVKTMDVGKYNTINLQAELAAGLQEVLGAEDAAHFGQETEGQPEAEIVQNQEEYESSAPEEMEESEVFFGATGEMEDMPWETGEEPGEEEDIEGTDFARMQDEEMQSAGMQKADAEGAGLTGWEPEGALPDEPDGHGGKQPWKSAGQREDVVDFAKRQPEAAPEGQTLERQQSATDGAKGHDVIDFAERQLAVERRTANAIAQQSAAADAMGSHAFRGQTPETEDSADRLDNREGSPADGRADRPGDREGSSADGRADRPGDREGSSADGRADSPGDRESSSADETARQVMEQLRSETAQSQGREHENDRLPRELAEVLSQEANGQISLVLPESAAIEKQITGQMKIEDILVEWERMKKENEEKRKEEVRKHILHQTGPMFTEFEAAIRDGLLEKLEKETEDKAKGGRRERTPTDEGQVLNNLVQGQAEGGEEETARASSEDSRGTVPEKGTQQAGTGFGDEQNPGYERASGDGAEVMEDSGFRTGLAEAGNGVLTEDADYIEEAAADRQESGQAPNPENCPEYIEDRGFEGRPNDEDETCPEDKSVYRADSVSRQMSEDSRFDSVSGKEETTRNEDASDFEGEFSCDMETDYGENSDYSEASDYEGEFGYGEAAGYEGESGYGEASDYEGESGYGEASGYEGEFGCEGRLEEGTGNEDGLSYEEETGYTEGPDAGEVAEAAEKEEELGYREEYGTEEAEYREAADYESGMETSDSEDEEDAGYGTEEAGFADSAEEAWEAEYHENEEEIQEADIIEEIEEQQEQTGKADKRPKSARLKKQKAEEASEKEEEQPIERDQAKVRSLSREEKELFASFIQSRHSKEQLIKAIDSLSMAAYTGNLIITGEEGMDMLTLAKNIVRDVRVTDRNFSGKVAKITGQGLNDRKVEETLEQLNNGALIIETASGMSPETAVKLHRSLQQERVGIIVIMVDTKKAMKKLLLGTPDLYGDFPARIDLEALSNDTLVSFGKQYAREMEYSIDDLGMLALHTRIEELQTIDHVVTVAEVKQIVDEAIHHASRKTLGHFFDVLLARRYDDEDMVILTEKDFVA